MSANPEYIVGGAGAIALTAGFAEHKGFPPNGVKIVAATLFLVFLAALSKGSRIEPIVRAVSWLMLLAAVYAFVPAFERNRKKPSKKKVKRNG